MIGYSRIPLIAVCLIALALTTNCSREGESPQAGEASQANSSEAAIRAFTKQWVMAWSQRDIAAIVGLYADKFVVMPSGQNAIEDSAELESYLRRVTAGERFSFTYHSQEVRAQGDFAVERGVYVLSFTSAPGGEIRTENGNLMRLVEKGPDGDWHISFEIWNVILSTGVQ
jgi:uncharacterized protein (TIGR02246 family)